MFQIYHTQTILPPLGLTYVLAIITLPTGLVFEVYVLEVTNAV